MKYVSNSYPKIKNHGLRYPIQIRNRSLSYTLANVFGSVYFASSNKSYGYFAVSQTLYFLKWSCDKVDTQKDNS